MVLKDVGKECTTPPTNRGVGNTQERGMRALVDWVSATFKTGQELEEIFELIGLKKELFIEAKKGVNGYRKKLSYGHIHVLYDGPENQGIMLDISGQGCREYEVAGGYEWSELFRRIIEFDGDFTRLDVAVDEFKGALEVERLKRKAKAGEIRSKFRTSIPMEKVRLKDGSSKGNTIYFGHPQSILQIKVYDKLMERKEAGKEVEEGIDHWNRLEVTVRKERAVALANIIGYNHYTVGQAVMGIVKYYITVTNKSKDKNKARWPVAKFWEVFIRDASVLKLTQQAPDYTIERSEQWIQKQTTPTLAMLFLAYENDFTKMIHNLMDGTNRLTDKHYDMINRYWESQGMSPMTKADFNDMLNDNIYNLNQILQDIKKSPRTDDSGQSDT